jgi:hypothetical protein
MGNRKPLIAFDMTRLAGWMEISYKTSIKSMQSTRFLQIVGRRRLPRKFLAPEIYEAA